MGGFFSYIFNRQPPGTPVSGFHTRIINIFKVHYRGLLGMLIPLIIIPLGAGKRNLPHRSVQCMWLWMAWSFLLQPVNIPVTGLIPLFFLPLTGVLSSVMTCQCYINHNFLLLLLSNMLLLLINNSGLDKRLIVWMLTAGGDCHFSASMLLFKSSLIGFILSIFSNKLIVASTLTQYLTPVYTEMQTLTRNSGLNYEKARYVNLCAVQTACAIGSIVIVHGSYTTMAFKTIFEESGGDFQLYPDMFNYFQYSFFAFPVALGMFLLNYLYYLVLLKIVQKKPPTPDNMKKIREKLKKYKSDIPTRISLHEQLSLFMYVCYLAAVFSRFSIKYFGGWSRELAVNLINPMSPVCKDATVAALFVMLMHMLPSSCAFLRFFTASKKSQLQKIKPESGILWWRFVDKNLNYGYMFLIGSGVALTAACRETGLNTILIDDFATKMNKLPEIVAPLVICLTAVLLANIMSGVAACVTLLPLVLGMYSGVLSPSFLRRKRQLGVLDLLRVMGPLDEKRYLGALAVGIASSFGFMFPFLYTPAYFTNKIGKVPIKTMAMYGFGSALICTVVLWAGTAFYGPVVWNPQLLTIGGVPLQLEITTPLTTTTELFSEGMGGENGTTTLSSPSG